MSSTTIKDGFHGGSDNQAIVNADGSLNVNVSNITTGVPANVNVHDGTGTPITSTSGALNVYNTATVTTEQAGLNDFRTSQYSIGASTVQLTPTPLTGRSSVSLRVTTTDSNTAVFIGNSSSVTVTNGYPLFNGDTLGLDLTDSKTIYAVSTLPGQTVYVLEIA